VNRFPFLRWRVTKSCGVCNHPPRPEGVSRRHFFMMASAAVGATGLAGVSASGGLSDQAGNFPPPPAAVSPILELYDTHVHTAPDVFARSVNDEQAARLYRDKGMAGMVLKNHVVATADRAWFCRRHVHGIKLFGGIVLNYSVGAINPSAVNWMPRMLGSYGRMVWFPTFDADNHVKHFHDGVGGIKVLGSDGKVIHEAIQVLKICAKQKLVVNTGHLSAAEALALIGAARDVGADRILVTHVQSEVPNFSVDDMKRAAAMGAKLELVAIGPLYGPHAYLKWMRSWRQVRVQETVRVIEAVGAEHFVLGTDLGSAGNPTPADGMVLFVTELMAHGISKDEIRLMGRANPAKLLMG
jgi:hypothetical protein